MKVMSVFPHPRRKGRLESRSRDFHANFHAETISTPNDEKIRRRRRGGFQTRPGRFRDEPGQFPLQGGFQTRPNETVLRRYVSDVFHANPDATVTLGHGEFQFAALRSRRR